MPHKTLRLILGDQLNSQHSWFQSKNPENHYLMMEIGQELQYVRHHILKISAFFLAMRNFAKELEDMGHAVQYIKLDDHINTQNLGKNILNSLKSGSYSRFEYLLPDEYRLDQELISISDEINRAFQIPSHGFDTEHFLTHRNYLKQTFGHRKTYVMETFYRKMRKDFNILMEGNTPEQNTWNFDKENRKPYDGKTPIPKPLLFPKSIESILAPLEKKNLKFLGDPKGKEVEWPISRKEALDLLDHFTRYQLKHFGTFEDAMEAKEPFLFHSRLSFALNIKLLHPKEVLDQVVKAYRDPKNEISLPQAEGFIRQVLGWREFMRSQYWLLMPEFASKNFFSHSRPLPEWYWNGNTKMNCLKTCINQSLELAYAHHIQRLMITGNFALLAGIHPDEVDAWYLGIYIDAVEWVEITNTRGMSQYADGGGIATKPYVSGGNYISKMSNYCKNCIYDPKIRYGEKACPFNSLYWNFFLLHEEKLSGNPRLSLVFRNLKNMKSEELIKIKEQANKYLSELHSI